MSEFEPSRRHLQEVSLFCFNLNNSAAEVHRLLQEAYGEGYVDNSSVREWLRRFKSDDFEVEDKERSGRTQIFEDQELAT